LAFGKAANANGQLSVAIGPNVQALSDDSIGIGAGATTGVRATAIGRGANAIANGTAIGASANAAHAGATAIGQNAVTTAADQIRLGTASNSYSLPGLLTTSDAAQTGQEFFVTIDNNGTLGKGAQSSAALSQMGNQIASLQQGQALIDDQVAALQQGQANLFNLRSLDRKEWRRGIAAATAMTTAPFPSAPGKTSYTLATGGFRGEVAFSANISHRLNTGAPIALFGGVAHSGGKNTAVKAGLAGEF
jgi:trimeric autotransporter adhesin